MIFARLDDMICLKVIRCAVINILKYENVWPRGGRTLRGLKKMGLTDEADGMAWEPDSCHRDLQSRLDEKTREMERITIQAIMTVANTEDAKDDYTKGHSMRVAAYARLLACKLGWPEEDVQNIYYVAMLHDVGKIGIPDAVLNKPFRLTELEFRLIKGHTMIGAEILKDFKMFANIGVGAKYHHERYDGKGYPEGLKAEAIPLVARVIALADAYDAMTSSRVYRRRLSDETVMEELQKGKGTQWDPALVDVLIELIREGALEQQWMREEEMAAPIFDSEKICGAAMGKESVSEAPTDYLTGLPNRRSGESMIEAGLKAWGGCLLMVGLDHLGRINRTYGRLAGDCALKITAEVLRGVCGGESVCRMGNDEFLCFVERVTDHDGASAIADRILDAFAKRQKEAAVPGEARLSIGISLSGVDGHGFEELRRKADRVLYHVRQGGDARYDLCRGDDKAPCRVGQGGDARYGFYQRADMVCAPKQSKKDLETVLRLVRERDGGHGALGAEDTEFAHLHDFLERFSRGNSRKTKLLLFTLFSSEGVEVGLERMEAAMQCMEQSICKSLRGDDVGTRYSSTQFLVAMTETGREDVSSVTDRIVQNYFKLYGGKDITLAFDVADC